MKNYRPQGVVLFGEKRLCKETWEREPQDLHRWRQTWGTMTARAGASVPVAGASVSQTAPSPSVTVTSCGHEDE